MKIKLNLFSIIVVENIEILKELSKKNVWKVLDITSIIIIIFNQIICL